MEQLLKDFERYLLVGPWAPSSVRQYLYEARNFLKFAAEGPEKFKREDVEEYMAADNRRRNKQATKQRRLAGLRAFFEYLVSRKILQENPCVGIRSPRVPYAEKLVLSQEQVRHLLEAVSRDTTLSGKKSLAMVALLYYLGLRVSEVTGLELSHITEGDPLWLTVHMKGDKVKIFPINNPSLQSYFLSWWKFRKSFDGPVPALFINLKTKAALSVRTVERRVRNFGKMAELPIRIHPHMLRRCFATHLHQNGADIFTIARLMGHARIDVTHRYVSAMDEKQRAALLLLP